MNNLSRLVKMLEDVPNSKEIVPLIHLVEEESTVNIIEHIDSLTGVWELRWSSSISPLLNYSPLLDNLQILEPEKGRGINVLRPKGFYKKILSTKILASLKIIDHKRMDVSFKEAGIFGPKLLGKNIRFSSKIRKSQRGWLDTSVLTPDLRICRGYKGTLFALLKRNDLLINDFF